MSVVFVVLKSSCQGLSESGLKYPGILKHFGANLLASFSRQKSKHLENENHRYLCNEPIYYGERFEANWIKSEKDNIFCPASEMIVFGCLSARRVFGPWGQKKCPLKRGVRLWEVENIVFGMYVVGSMTKFLLTRGVRLREVSGSGGSTIYLELS